MKEAVVAGKHKTTSGIETELKKTIKANKSNRIKLRRLLINQ
jgi:hypothetical protein